jgi:hypothetical protein
MIRKTLCDFQVSRTFLIKDYRAFLGILTKMGLIIIYGRCILHLYDRYILYIVAPGGSHRTLFHNESIFLRTFLCISSEKHQIGVGLERIASMLIYIILIIQATLIWLFHFISGWYFEQHTDINKIVKSFINSNSTLIISCHMAYFSFRMLKCDSQ